MPDNKPEKQEEFYPPATEQPTVEQMIMHAIDKYGPEGAESGVAVIERLVALKRDQEKWDAEKEFFKELSEFQQEAPMILKTKLVDFVSDAGGRTNYKFAPIQDIMKPIKPFLYPRGFSISWDTVPVMVGDKPHVEATVILMHRNGHSIRSKFTVPIPEKLAKMNEIHRNSTAKAVAIRIAFTDVLGLITTDEDTDGNPPSEPLTEDQVKTITKAMEDAMPPASQERLLKLLKVEKVEDLGQSDFDHVMKLIADKKKKFQEA